MDLLLSSILLMCWVAFIDTKYEYFQLVLFLKSRKESQPNPIPVGDVT